jgi:hemerythrin superfamily protein
MARNSKAAPDALQLLKKDHSEVDALFTEFEESTDADEKADLAARICRMLTIHASCEEELVYPAAHQAIDEDLVYEAEVEHQCAKDLIARIEDADPDAPDFEAMVKVLGEYVRHHVREEEGELFTQLKRSDVDLAALGAELAERKLELEAASSAVPDDDDDDEDFDDDDDDEDEDEDDEPIDVDGIGDDEGEPDRDRAP